MRLGVAETSQLSNIDLSEASAFTIKASAKAFKILSDSLYSNKIKAVVRELACNAYDAHVAVGKEDTPCDIHLPTRTSPEFWIRDFGPGLSEEDVLSLYTTYFESSKLDSNQMIGALGLGSKSPFSYTSTFTITSWNGGMKKSYMAFISPEGFPKVQKLFEEETNEPNGLEVRVPVMKSDEEEFKDEVALIFRPFEISPNVVNMPSFGAHKYEVIHEGASWKLITRRQTNSSIFFRYGKIEYFLTPDTFESKIYPYLSEDKDEDVRLFIKRIFYKFSSTALLIDAPLGLFDIAASREALSFDENTIRNVIGLVRSTILDIKKTYDEETKDLEVFERLTFVRKTFGTDFFRYAKDSAFFMDPEKVILAKEDWVHPIYILKTGGRNIPLMKTILSPQDFSVGVKAAVLFGDFENATIVKYDLAVDGELIPIDRKLASAIKMFLSVKGQTVDLESGGEHKIIFISQNEFNHIFSKSTYDFESVQGFIEFVNTDAEFDEERCRGRVTSAKAKRNDALVNRHSVGSGETWDLRLTSGHHPDFLDLKTKIRMKTPFYYIVSSQDGHSIFMKDEADPSTKHYNSSEFKELIDLLDHPFDPLPLYVIRRGTSVERDARKSTSGIELFSFIREKIHAKIQELGMQVFISSVKENLLRRSCRDSILFYRHWQMPAPVFLTKEFLTAFFKRFPKLRGTDAESLLNEVNKVTEAVFFSDAADAAATKAINTLQRTDLQFLIGDAIQEIHSESSKSIGVNLKLAEDFESIFEAKYSLVSGSAFRRAVIEALLCWNANQSEDLPEVFGERSTSSFLEEFQIYAFGKSQVPTKEGTPS